MNRRYIYKSIAILVTAVFLVSQMTLAYPSQGFAQTALNLPTPGTMVGLSPSYTPAIIAGLTVYPDNPLQFDFIIDTGDDNLQGEALQKESEKLIGYFMAALTVPEDEMWVNLSPYEKDRIIAEGLGDTALGRDMLAQDYILKQLASSLMYPEGALGKKFWNRIEARILELGARESLASSFEHQAPDDFLQNIFNKIWIVPEEATIYARGTNIFIADSRLKVMMEEDYLALSEARSPPKSPDFSEISPKTDSKLGASFKSRASSGEHQASSNVLREIIIPEIEREVNEGKNFAPLRQMYHAMILATWYKNNLKESVLGQVYANQNKIEGVDIEDKDVTDKIYSQYIEAFKKGAYNYIREDYDETTQEIISRKYFSGGVDASKLSEEVISARAELSPQSWLQARSDNTKVRVTSQVRLEQDSSSMSEIGTTVLSSPLKDFLKTIDKDTYGVRGDLYILSNELRQYEVLQHLEAVPIVNNGVHIGFSSMLNLNIMAKRKSAFGIIGGIDDGHTKMYESIEKTILHPEVLDGTKSVEERRSQFVARLVDAFDTNGVYKSTTSGKRTSHEGLIKEELEKPGSWLSSDEAFEYIQKMFQEKRIGYLKINVTEVEKFEKISQWLNEQGLRVDTLYTSNIFAWLGGGDSSVRVPDSEKRERFVEGLYQIANRDTILLNAKEGILHRMGSSYYVDMPSLEVIPLNEPKAIDSETWMQQLAERVTDDAKFLKENFDSANLAQVAKERLAQIQTIADEMEIFDIVEEGGGRDNFFDALAKDTESAAGFSADHFYGRMSDFDPDDPFYRGMRLSVDQLNKIIDEGLSVSQNYPESYFTRSLPRVLDYSFYPSTRRGGVARQDFVPVIFRANGPKLKQALGDGRVDYGGGLLMKVDTTVPFELFDQVLVFDKTTNQFVPLIDNAVLSSPESFYEASQQVKETDNFKRLGNVLGFTGMGADLERKYVQALSVQGHDLRVAMVAKTVGERLDVNAERAAFLGLVHDYGAMPFRHLARSSQVIDILKRAAFSSEQHRVKLLREDGIEISTDLESDIVGFDINHSENLSAEGKVATASESVEGVFEDIFFGIRYGIINASEISGDVRTMLLMNDITNEDITRRAKEDFDAFVVEMSEKVLLENITDIDALVEKAQLIKREARARLITEKIHGTYDVQAVTNEVGQMVMNVINQLLDQMPEKDSQESLLAAVERVMKMSDDDIIKANTDTAILQVDEARRVDASYSAYKEEEISWFLNRSRQRNLSSILSTFAEKATPSDTMFQIEATEEEIIEALKNPIIDEFDFEMGVFRIRGTNKWIFNKGTEGGILGETLSDRYRSGFPYDLFDIIIHNHFNKEEFAVPSYGDLAVGMQRQLRDTKMYIRSKKGLTLFESFGMTETEFSLFDNVEKLDFIAGLEYMVKFKAKEAGLPEDSNVWVVDDSMREFYDDVYESYQNNGTMNLTYLPWEDVSLPEISDFNLSERLRSESSSQRLGALYSLFYLVRKDPSLGEVLSAFATDEDERIQALVLDWMDREGYGLEKAEIITAFQKSQYPIVQAHAEALASKDNKFRELLAKKDFESLISEGSDIDDLESYRLQRVFTYTNSLSSMILSATRISRDLANKAGQPLLNVFLKHLEAEGLKTGSDQNPYTRAAKVFRQRWGMETDASGLNASPEYGGIDFNAESLNIREQGDAPNINFTNMPNINQNAVRGATPVIINIVPITNFLFLIGQGDDYKSSDSNKLSYLSPTQNKPRP